MSVKSWPRLSRTFYFQISRNKHLISFGATLERALVGILQSRNGFADLGREFLDTVGSIVWTLFNHFRGYLSLALSTWRLASSPTKSTV